MLSFYTTRTNELYVTLKYEASGEPAVGATVTVELREKGVVIAGTAATVPEVSSGNYYTKYPILATVQKDRQYTLHIKVILSGQTVIDEDYACPVATK